MLRFGVWRRDQYARAGPERRFFGSRVSYSLLDVGDGPTSDEVRAFEDISFTLRTSNGSFRTTFRCRFKEVDEAAMHWIQNSYPAGTELHVEDRAASHGLTSVEFAEQVFRAFPNATFEASDAVLVLIRLSLPTGETYIVEPNGQPLQYIKPPFVVSVHHPESWRFPLNRMIAARAKRRFRRLSLPAGWMESGTATYIVSKIPCMHPEALALAKANPAFQLRARSVFERMPGNCHVLRTMNILNRAYLPEARLLEGVEAAFDTLRPGGIWIVGRTLEEDFSNEVSFLRRGKNGWELLARLGRGSEIEGLALGARARRAGAARTKEAAGKPKSLLLVCSSYPPVIGGSELEAQRVCAALLRRGYQVTVVTAGGGSMPRLRDWIDPEGVPVRLYAARWTGAAKNIVFALRVAVMMLFERRNYQLVYFLMQGLHVAGGLPVARLLGKRIVMKIGGSGVITEMTRSLTGRLELRWLRQWAYRLMILNEGMREEALRARFDPDQLLWMPNPVNTDEFVPSSTEGRARIRKELGIPPGAVVVVYTGRLAAVKALPSLVDAFGQVARQIPEAMLVLVGDGPLRASLAEQAGRLGLTGENLRFTGHVEPAKVPEWLRLADVFTLVSYSEGLACALLEAMATGLPSVVSDIAANRQLIDSGQHGFRAPAGDAEAIAAAIIKLLENAPLRAAMGQAARQRVLESYTIERVADRYEELIHQALAVAE